MGSPRDRCLDIGYAVKLSSRPSSPPPVMRLLLTFQCRQRMQLPFEMITGNITENFDRVDRVCWECHRAAYVKSYSLSTTLTRKEERVTGNRIVIKPPLLPQEIQLCSWSSQQAARLKGESTLYWRERKASLRRASKCHSAFRHSALPG